MLKRKPYEDYRVEVDVRGGLALGTVTIELVNQAGIPIYSHGPRSLYGVARSLLTIVESWQNQGAVLSSNSLDSYEALKELCARQRSNSITDG